MSDSTNTKADNKEDLASPEVAEAMGVSALAFEEIQYIVGHHPSIEELSTLLAMWEANGQQQGLYTWLCGQPHTYEAHDYIYNNFDDIHNNIREPRVKDCIAVANTLCTSIDASSPSLFAEQGDLIYMVGNVADDFLDSDYARRCLHIANNPIQHDNPEEETAYITLIIDALSSNGILHNNCPIARGGLFVSLVECCDHQKGFSILTCREVRLDAFLFGERPGRFIVSLPEQQDNYFLLKMDEARLNCCFLGRVTKGRVVVDDMDFGPIGNYKSHNK